jgi:L-arabinose isomerase
MDFLFVIISVKSVFQFRKKNNMIDIKHYEVWFVTGSQHLYGEETLRQVDEHSKVISEALNASVEIPVKVVFKPVVKTPEEILTICNEANYAKNCIGIITWMHFFSLKNVDKRLDCSSKTIAALAYPVQP